MGGVKEPIPSSKAEYSVEIDTVTKGDWHSILRLFDDANVIQTWSYGAARWGQDNLSHLVLKRDGQIVAAAQTIITKVPVLAAGLAYVKTGPLWQIRNTERDPETLRRMLRALREVYAVSRGLLLRVYPAGTEDGTGAIRAIFEEEGFARDLSIGIPRTAILDLSHSLDRLRSSFKSTWRRNLVRAERNGLRVIEGRSDAIFDAFVALYKQMLRRKSIVGVVDISYFQQIQRDLPDDFKMTVILCEYDGELIAGLAVPVLGTTAQNLLAATGDKGLDLRGSYLVHWRMLEWLKTQDCRWYDLDAINHQHYPGISQFKIGFAGRLGWEAEYLGQFEYCTRSISRWTVKAAEQLRKASRTLNAALNTFGHAVGSRDVSRES